MTTKPPATPANTPASAGWLPLLVVPLPRVALDELKPVGLLPRWRFTTPILPIIGGATRATNGGDNLGGGEVSKGFGEGHGQTVSRKNKSAMPKIKLVVHRQCRHCLRMSNTNHTEAKAQIKAILEGKFLKLINEGISPDAAFEDVMGAFEQQFPGLIEKLG